MVADRRRARRGLAASLVLVITASACWGDDDEPSSSSAPPPTTTAPDGGDTVPPIVTVDGRGVDRAGAASPLGLRLSEGAASAPAVDVVELVDGIALTVEEVAGVLARLPLWSVPETDVETFNRPPESLKPPLIGDIVEATFPPPADPGPPPGPDGEPLEVLRYQPEGAVDVAPFLSVTFDQPMVPLATLEQLDAGDVPVVVTPAIEGRWRWIGTRTLRFEVIPGITDRLPAATEYRVEVPAGTTAANGAQLAETVSWTFTTPAPRVIGFTGESDSLPLEPVFVAGFDQRVDPAAVLATIRVEADGEPLAIRLATDSEVDADEAARQANTNALDGRAVAFRAVDPFPTDTALSIVIGPGTPSAEGPLTSTAPATYSARTYGALQIVRTDCGYGDDCVPGLPFVVEFSNALDVEAFSAEQVSVSPAVPGLRINVYSNVIEVSGATRGRTTYRVTFAAALRDVFGQTLGEDRTVEFEVGPAEPMLQGLQRDWITTDPLADRPTVAVRTVNHDAVHVVAWAVDPTQTTAFREYLEHSWSDTKPAEPDWMKVFDEVIEIDAAEDTFVETAIDLSPAFDRAGSQIVVRVEPTETFAPDDERYWNNRPTVAWVQSTTLGVDAVNDDDELLIWTTDLRTGEPVGGVPVELIGDGRVATTDDGGLARVALGDAGITGLWANGGDRTAFLPSEWYQPWQRMTPADQGRWYVFDDRGIYRPGETVRLTGWVRRLAVSEDAQLALYGDGVEVEYHVSDPQGVDLGSGVAALNALGGFNLAIELPEGANLGTSYVNLQLTGVATGQQSGWSHDFQIQEFRRPEFEVTARQESSGPFYTAEPATVAVDAEYYAGGPLPDAEVSWLVSTRETNYQPPNWDDYTFGIWQPWWWFGEMGAVADVAYSEPCFDCGPGTATEYEEFAGRTDTAGTHYLQIDFDGPDVDLPATVTAEATVFDVNRQAWASRTDLLVHPARYYVGLRSDRTFVEQGTPIRYDAVVTDVDGTLVAGRPVEVIAGRLEWTFGNGTWGEEVVDPQTCTFTSSVEATDGSMRCEFATEVGGSYRITAVVTDATGHRNRTQTTTWVSGGQGRPTRGVDRQDVTIVPDRETYAPGDTAELLVQAPFAPAHGVITVVHNGIVSAEQFEATDGSAVLQIPIEDAHVPNLKIQIDMAGAAVRTADDGTPLPDAPLRPAYATGQIDLRVPPITRALTVTASPASPAVEPGDDTSVTVQVVGPDGEPVVGADVAVVVVDEAVLALTGYELGDPLAVFYADLWADIRSTYSRSSILLTRSDLLGGDSDDSGGAPAATEAPAAGDGATSAPVEESAGEGADAQRDSSGQPIEIRQNFDALAVYAPDRTTAADGTVTVDVPLPDTLTRYRVMAVAVDGADRFGKGESTITARLPLMVRPSPPRFLNFGDRIELPVIVQNQTDAALDVDVVVQGANLTLAGGAPDPTVDPSGGVGKRITVPANDRVEVRFPAAADQVGTARIRVAAVATNGAGADATELELPVYTPATAEAFATYGVIDDTTTGGAIGQPLVAPTGVFPQFGGLEIGTSSTALQALTDAVIYLADYPYDTPDGYASRLMAIASLRDVLDAFDAAGLPDPSALDQRAKDDIAALAALQNDDGGWSWWSRGLESVAWQTLHVAHALVLAERAGYTVPADTRDRALAFLDEIEQHIPADHGLDVRTTLRAYAVHVRTLAGDRDVAEATDVYRDGGIAVRLDALAWLWPAIDDGDIRAEIERRFANAATETAGAATFATGYGEDAYVIANSDRRTDGVILDALISQTPGSDLIPKVVAGLLGHQTRGRWNSAQDNAFVLAALKRYFDTFEAVTPDFVARAWLGETYAAEHEFRGRTTERASTLVPMSELTGGLVPPGGGATSVIIQREGSGRLYYRLGLRYAPDDLILDARDEGFVVDRVYEAIDDPGDVTRDADGTWHIRAGASVRVTVTMVADARRTHVALIDPLPAGLEPVNPALAVSQTFRPDAGDDGEDDGSGGGEIWCWCWYWFEHQNLRDDRVEAFTSYLEGGTYEYTYVARATTPGEFVVPPARAEELYAPEVFGRSASTRVVVV